MKNKKQNKRKILSLIFALAAGVFVWFIYVVYKYEIPLPPSFGESEYSTDSPNVFADKVGWAIFGATTLIMVFPFYKWDPFDTKDDKDSK